MYFTLCLEFSGDSIQRELDEARKEVDHLLRTVQNLEKEKTSLQNRLASNK